LDHDEPTTPIAFPCACEPADVAGAGDVPDTAGVLSVETALIGPVG
jgi:hypothetical protein